MRMRIMSFKTMLRQEIGWFDLDVNNLGALVTRLSSDAASLKGLTGPTLGAILTAVGALIAALVISFTAGWKLTLVILCFAPLMVFTGIIQGQQISQAGQKKAGTSDSEDGGKVRLSLARERLAHADQYRSCLFSTLLKPLKTFVLLSHFIKKSTSSGSTNKLSTETSGQCSTIFSLSQR